MVLAQRPFKIDVFEDDIFVTLFDHSMLRMHKFGYDNGTIEYNLFNRLSDIKVLHPLKQYVAANGIFLKKNKIN